MNSIKKNEFIVGVLFITATVAYSIGMLILDPILSSSNYITEVSENENQIILASFLILIDAVAVGGIGIVIYPILKKRNETVAFAYAGARIVECVFFIINAIGILTLSTLSQEFTKVGAPDDSHYQTLGTLLLEASDWAFIFGFYVAFTISSLILNFFLYKSKLVPRWLSGWGFIGALSLWLYYLLQFLNISYVEILFLPIAVQEMAFAVWLIVKGFNFTEIDSVTAKIDVNEAK